MFRFRLVTAIGQFSIGALLALWFLMSGCSSHSGAGLGLSLGGGPSGSFDTNQAAIVLSIVGEATWQESPSSARQPLTVGSILPPGAVVDSDRSGEVQLLLPGGAGTLTLQSGTRIVLTGQQKDGALGVYVVSGRVDGGLSLGSIQLSNACGASLHLSPQAGMTAPFSFGDTLPQELWDAMIGLGLNPDNLLPPLPSELLLGKFGPDTFVAPAVVVVPEPEILALTVVGLLALLGGRRKRP